MKKISYSGYGFPPELIQQAIWLYLRFSLSFRDVEDLLAERGITVSYGTVRRWVNHFGPLIAADLRKRRPKPHTTWHLDEVYLKIAGRLVILRHERRRLISLCVGDHPAAEWICQQITEAFPWGEAPDHLIRDRDASYGHAVTRRLAAMGIRDHPTAPRSPWQNGYAERLIGSIRRECLDHIVVFGEAHLRRILAGYATYYNDTRTHLSVDKDSPSRRPVQRLGQVSARPILGGLHHEYWSYRQKLVTA